ncbi:hypothetical protein [Microbacterium natoriense]|uniref:hypothetical protein n=1 Tax=Microbacterium natoriense TaxID=284570 RepID=UPI0031DA9F75
MGSEWHPIFLTTEISPGVWEMQNQTDYAPFGKIELRRIDERTARYRVTLSGGVIGWSTTLQVACERLYEARLEQRRRAVGGAPNKSL